MSPEIVRFGYLGLGEEAAPELLTITLNLLPS